MSTPDMDGFAMVGRTDERRAATPVGQLRAILREHGLLIPSGPGLYGWGAELEAVFQGLDRMLSAVGREPGVRVLRFAPVMTRADFEKSEFARSFPQLFGAVHAFTGDDHDHAALAQAMADGADWGDATGPTDFVLTPAACYPVYPHYVGELPTTGAHVDVSSYCFRHEPSTQIGRLVAFRQREFVRIADSATVDTWLAQWRERSLAAIRSLGLDAWCEPAADPFFGRGARLLASGQREQGLKVEIIASIDGCPVALSSCNNHREHFGRAFGIGCTDGTTAHSACVGFGQERLALALIAAHGPVLDSWPTSVREVLWN